MLFKGIVAAAMLVGASAAASAMPAVPFGAPAPAVTKVLDGCGPYGHRNGYGQCRPGGQAGGYGYGRRACPPGFHLGPEGRRCWPNRY